MIIDIHTHIYSAKIRKNRQKYLTIDPLFKRFYNSPKSVLAGAKDLIDSMEKNNVDMSVVFGFPWSDISVLKEENDYIMEAVEKNSGRLTGFCCLDPFVKNAVLEVERCFEGGLKGVGELFFPSEIDNQSIERLAPVMEICLERDMPVLIHTNEPIGHNYPGKTQVTLIQIYTLVKRFPKNKIILAHMGGGIFFYNLLKKEVKHSLENVYFDTALSHLIYDISIFNFAIDIIGADRIIFGSDFPIEQPCKYFEAFRFAKISRKNIESIRSKNAMKILD